MHLKEKESKSTNEGFSIRRLLLVIVTPLVLSGHSAYSSEMIFSPTASTSLTECDQQLSPKGFPLFHKIPNDQNRGFVTDAYSINSSSIKAAYRLGLFPWDLTPDGRGKWYALPERGVLIFSELRIPRSHRKYLKRWEEKPGEYRVTFDTAFEKVIRACSNRGMDRQGQPLESWIAEPFIQAWLRLHQEGHAHSVEVWRGKKLVAGNYGTFIAGVYSGESMFHTEPDVAKLAFYALIERLKSRGHTWIDTQQALGLTEMWGAKTISRDEYLRLLHTTQSLNLDF